MLSHSVATDTRRQPYHRASTTHHHPVDVLLSPNLEDSSVYKHQPLSFLYILFFIVYQYPFFVFGLCPTKLILATLLPPTPLAWLLAPIV